MLFSGNAPSALGAGRSGSSSRRPLDWRPRCISPPYFRTPWRLEKAPDLLPRAVRLILLRTKPQIKVGGSKFITNRAIHQRRPPGWAMSHPWFRPFPSDHSGAGPRSIGGPSQAREVRGVARWSDGREHCLSHHVMNRHKTPYTVENSPYEKRHTLQLGKRPSAPGNLADHSRRRRSSRDLAFIPEPNSK